MGVIDQFRPKHSYELVLEQREKDGWRFSELYANSFEAISCPACQTKGEPHFQKWGFSHDLCPVCGTFYVSPRPNEKLLIDYYNDFEAPNMWTALLVETDSTRKAVQFAPRVDLIIKHTHLNKDPIAVDIGAGSGAFALALKNSGKFSEVHALEIADDCIEVCKKIGLYTIRGSVEVLEKASVDFLSMNDLIEHLYNPQAFVDDCYKSLKSNGYLSIATPNGEGFDFQILKEATKNITPPEHINYFNPHSIKILLENSGFKDIVVLTPGVLDVEIIKRDLEKGLDLSTSNQWLNHLYSKNDDTLSAFQKFLADNALSSHMLAIARK